MSFARAFRPSVVAVVVLTAAALTACGAGSDGARGTGSVDRKAGAFLGAQLCVTNVNLATASVLLKPEFDKTPENNSAWKNNNFWNDGEAFPPGTTKCVENEDASFGSGYIRVVVGGAPVRACASAARTSSGHRAAATSPGTRSPVSVNGRSTRSRTASRVGSIRTSTGTRTWERRATSGSRSA